MLMRRSRRWIFTIAITILILIPAAGYAADQSNFVPLASYQNTALDNFYSSSAGGSNSLGTYFSNLFKIALSAGAILAVVRLVWAGYNYMGSDMWSTKDKAKGIIQEVVWGMLLLLGTYLILYQINPCILNLDILQSFSGSGQACTY